MLQIYILRRFSRLNDSCLIITYIEKTTKLEAGATWRPSYMGDWLTMLLTPLIMLTTANTKIYGLYLWLFVKHHIRYHLNNVDFKRGIPSGAKMPNLKWVTVLTVAMWMSDDRFTERTSSPLLTVMHIWYIIGNLCNYHWGTVKMYPWKSYGLKYELLDHW